MKANYKPIGNFIKEVKFRNSSNEINTLLGININKYYMPSVANIVGTDLSVYKVVKKGQFACNRMHVGRDMRLPIALSTNENDFIVSPAYDVFEIVNTKLLLPEYLMLWFSRSEFDRNTWFYTDADVRGGLGWKAFCEMQLPIPSIEKQKEIVAEYHTIQNRIDLNKQLIQKLEETAQAIYKQWFVDFEFPNEDGKPYKSSGGEMVESSLGEVPKGWEVKKMKSICSKIASGSTPTGGKESYFSSGISLIRSTNVFDFCFSYDDLAFIDPNQADKLKNVEIKENDVLFNITGVSVARCCMVPKNVLPARVNQHVMIIRTDIESNLSFYILMNLCSTDSKNKLLGISQSGSTREAINKGDIEEFELMIPGSNVLSTFQNIAKKVFVEKDLISFQNLKIEELKSLVLSKMATV